MLETNRSIYWAIRFKEDLRSFLNDGEGSENLSFLAEKLSLHEKTIKRWLAKEVPPISPKSLASFYSVFLNATSKDDFLHRCPEMVLEEVLRYGDQFLDEIKFTREIVDRQLFQEYFETDYVFRGVFYYLMAVNKTNTASETYLIYKFGKEAKGAISKMVTSGFAEIKGGKIALTDVFLGSIFDVRRIRSMIQKVTEEFATEDQFEEANRSMMLFRVFGVNKEGHQLLMNAACEYMEAVNKVFMDKRYEGPIAIASTQSMLILDNPLENENDGGMKQ